MPENTQEIVVAAKGSISNAPVGSTLPTDLDALDGAFFDLGLTTEDGAAFTYSEARTEIMAWQRSTAVRRIVTGRDLTTTYSLEQWNEESFKLAFGGGAWDDPGAGVFRYLPPDEDDPLAEYAQVIDLHDGDRHGRLVIPRGAVNEDVQTNLQRTSAAVLPVAFKALAVEDSTGLPADLVSDGKTPNWYYLSNDDAFAVAS